MRLIIFIITVGLILFLIPVQASAEKTVELYYFYEANCLACQSMSDTIVVFKTRYPGLTVVDIDIGQNQQNFTIYRDLLKIYQDIDYVTPKVIVGPTIFSGYSASVVSEIESAIIYCQSSQCLSPGESLKEYWTMLDSVQKNNWSGRAIFWLIILIIWPLLGSGAIIYTLKKYTKR